MSSNRQGQTGAGFTQSFGLVMLLVAGLVLAIMLIAVFAWQPWGAEVTPGLEGAPEGGAQEGQPDDQQGAPPPQSYHLVGVHPDGFSAPGSLRPLGRPTLHLDRRGRGKAESSSRRQALSLRR